MQITIPSDFNVVDLLVKGFGHAYQYK